MSATSVSARFSARSAARAIPLASNKVSPSPFHPLIREISIDLVPVPEEGPPRLAILGATLESLTHLRESGETRILARYLNRD